MQYPNFIWSSYQSQAVTADQEATINFYWERMESRGATSQYALYPTPGVSLLGTASSSPGRAHFYQDGREFAVVGTSLVEIDEAGTITDRGTVATGTNPARIVSNGDGGGQLLVTSGDNAYYYNLSTDVLTQIAALNGKATMCEFLQGYGFVLDAATSTVYSSALTDFSSWTTGTDFAQRSAASDRWISMAAVHPYLWLLGSQTSEVWYNAASSGFPFTKHPSGDIPYGIAAKFSRAVIDGTLLWLAATDRGERQILRASGFTPEPISDYPRQLIFADYSTVDDAQGDAFSWLGHSFYLLSFPTERVTWAYDITENKWFQWGTWIAEDNRYVDWRPRWHAMAFGEHRMLDAETGGVYMLSRTVHTDVDSRPIRRLRRAPALSYENKRLIYPGFELDLEPGLGTSTGQGFDPQVMLRISRDGGKTWGTEQMRSAGKVGEYDRRVRWNRCGAARRMVFEVSFTDPIPWRLTAAYLTPNPIGLPQKGAA